MKVIIPIVDLVLCGGCKVLLEIAEALIQHHHETEIIIPEWASIHYDNIPCKLTRIPSFQKENIPYGDIILTNFYATVQPAFAAWPDNCVRFSQGFEPLNIPTEAALESYQFDIPIISNSRWVDNLIYEHVGKRSTIVNPGIDLNVFYPQSLDNKLKQRKAILYIARSAEDGYALKGFADFYEAIKIVQQNYTEEFIVHLICPDRPLDLPGVPTKIFPAKNMEEMAELYDSADLFVSSSWFEGFSLPPLEAMACGTPVVTTNQNGNLDYAKHLENCYLTPAKDPSSLATGIIELLSDQSLYTQLMNGGFRTAKKFNKLLFSKNIVRALEDIHESKTQTLITIQ